MFAMHFHGKTTFARPGLHVWSDDGAAFDLLGSQGDGQDHWWRFAANLPAGLRAIHFKLFDRDGKGRAVAWEPFERTAFCDSQGRLPERVWFVEGSDRVLQKDPFAQGLPRARVHLITARRYHDGELYLWTPSRAGVCYQASGSDSWGPFFDLALEGEIQHLFNLKFVRQDGRFEDDFASRTWSAADGAEIWTHSEGTAILTAQPLKKRLRVHLSHQWGKRPVWMYIWQEGSDYAESVPVEGAAKRGWLTFTKEGLYTGIPYGFMFTTQDPSDSQAGGLWEDQEARRYKALGDDEEYWTLEGDATLFLSRPARTQRVVVEVAGRDPGCPVEQATTMQVRINRAQALLPPRFEKRADGSWLFWTYPGVTTSFRFGSPDGYERDEHRIRPPEPANGAIQEMRVHVVLGRAPVLANRPPPDRFKDPPFPIVRPGAVERQGDMQFVLHAPWCARVRLWGEWLAPDAEPLDLKSTMDGAYWWLQVPVNEIVKGLPPAFGGDYHGARYRFILNDGIGQAAHDALNGAKTVQDPAAGWVETSDPGGCSRLVRHSRYAWQSLAWQTPGWEYLQVYQLHPRRFTRRNKKGDAPLPPLLQVAHEVAAGEGYLRGLGTTAVLLMPLSEFEGRVSWGYNPSYFYAVEESYGGPDALKELVDACHQNGIAVLLDIVFNHAGTGHNILWEVSRETYIDGDTRWGALINFDNRWSIDFFAQNLLFWIQEYHIDGFRFDHTKTIIEGHDEHFGYIRRPGSGGGWEFLHALRQAVKGQDPNCLFMAEQLPNDWALTNYGGPMDSQWCDDWHDRIVGVCKGLTDQTGRLADAFKIGHLYCQQWYNVTNYSESHDEVGNVSDRIANIAGWGHGLRLNKVAAAATVLSRGIPLLFMGEESGEAGQFSFGADDELDLEAYETDEGRRRVRAWWQTMIGLRKGNPKIQGPAPLQVHCVEDALLAFSRGEGQEVYVVLNFGPQAVVRNLGHMNLPGGLYRELWNSSWPAFQVEWEDEHTNGGREARLHRGLSLNIPDYGVVILEKV